MILAIDQGTTGTACLVFDLEARLVASAYRELSQHFPRPGWVEHDAAEIRDAVRELAARALADAGVPDGGLTAIGITNQRETVCVWDPETGEPLHRALVWQDRRTAERCDALREAGHEPRVRERTGLVLDPYFSATKIAWLLEHVDGLAERAAAGRAAFGTIDAWLLWSLTGEYATDPSNASRTMLYDTRAGAWSPELLDLFGVPAQALPEVRPSMGVFGRLAPGMIPGHDGVPVTGVAGDQQSALYGHACLDPGTAKNTYGTGSFVLVNVGDDPPPPREGLLSTVAWGIGARRIHALEASIFVTGSAIQWLRDGLRIIDDARESESLAASLDGNDGVFFVPALTGLGSPHWDPYARGTIVGLTRGTGRAQVTRAALESIAYQTVDAVKAIEQADGHRITELKADGGAVANAWLMQFQADVLGVPVIVPDVAETTALGAALMAGVGVGAFPQAHVAEIWREQARYEPQIGDDERQSLLADWARAVGRARGWATPGEDAP